MKNTFESFDQNRIWHFEKTASQDDYDAKAMRIKSELGVFFPQWVHEKENIHFYTSEVFGLSGAFTSDQANFDLLKDELFDDCVSHVMAKNSGLSFKLLLDRVEQSALIKRTKEKRLDSSQYYFVALEKRLKRGVTDNVANALSESVHIVLKNACAGIHDLETMESFYAQRLLLVLPRQISLQEVNVFAEEFFYNRLIEQCRVVEERNFFDETSVFISNQTPHPSEKINASSVIRYPFLSQTHQWLYALSQEKLWAFSLDEIKLLKKHFTELQRDPTDVEIEVFAQTWSEHCKHKIFGATIEVDNKRSDVDVPKLVKSVFKTYIRGATEKVKVPYLKSVFEDNAGVIQITEKIDCAIKVETHNSPSALDPYGGALTGIVGVNRDILGVGLGAYPIANLDVFCVGPQSTPHAFFEQAETKKLHHPRRILEGVRVGVEHGGNKSGIPTVTGAVLEHECYLGKPLVFCGTIGLMPSDVNLIEKKIYDRDKIVMVGGRIGKDGIHGATFSSIEMNEDSPVSAVQLGDPLTQKRVWDFLIEARDAGLFRAVTDNGAGGLSSSIGELARLCGKKGGARMDVKKAKTKYPGLLPYELVISESQERMSFAVAPEKLETFLALAADRSVECSVLGEFVDSGFFEIYYGQELDGEKNLVARLDMQFLHEGLPALELKALIEEKKLSRRFGVFYELATDDELSALKANKFRDVLESIFCRILSHPNVRSRKYITEQYDHEVQSRTLRAPYHSLNHKAPCDGAALRLDRDGHEGLALGLGLSPLAIDPRAMAAYALDEAIRNALVSGLNPEHAALVDNFCWPDPLEGANNKNPIDAHRKLGDLVLTCQTIHDAAVALNLPFVSGKDSMKNDYRSGGLQISVLPTLLITVMGKIEDVRVIPASFVQPYGGDVYWISAQHGQVNPNGLYEWDAHRLKDFAKLFHTCMQKNFFLAAHDISEGGFLSATAEMFFGTGLSLDFDFGLAAASLATQAAGYLLFSERPSSFVVQAAAGVDLAEIFSKHGFYVHRLGKPITPSEDLPARFYSIDQKFYIEIEKLEGAYFGNQKSV